MNWIQGQYSQYLDPRVKRICSEVLYLAQKKCLGLSGSNAKGLISPSEGMPIVGCCSKYTDVLAIAKRMVERLKYEFKAEFEAGGYGMSVFDEPLKLQAKHKFEITPAAGNFATCMVFRGGLQYKDYNVDVVLTVHDSNLFTQCTYSLDIVIESE